VVFEKKVGSFRVKLFREVGGLTWLTMGSDVVLLRMNGAENDLISTMYDDLVKVVVNPEQQVEQFLQELTSGTPQAKD
jgi:hypothetical protein